MVKYLFVEIYLSLCREKAEQQVQEWFPRGGAKKPRQKKPVASKPTASHPAAKKSVKRGRKHKVSDTEDDENPASEG